MKENIPTPLDFRSVDPNIFFSLSYNEKKKIVDQAKNAHRNFVERYFEKNP